MVERAVEQSPRGSFRLLHLRYVSALSRAYNPTRYTSAMAEEHARVLSCWECFLRRGLGAGISCLSRALRQILWSSEANCPHGYLARGLSACRGSQLDENFKTTQIGLRVRVVEKCSQFKERTNVLEQKTVSLPSASLQNS